MDRSRYSRLGQREEKRKESVLGGRLSYEGRKKGEDPPGWCWERSQPAVDSGLSQEEELMGVRVFFTQGRNKGCHLPNTISQF